MVELEDVDCGPDRALAFTAMALAASVGSAQNVQRTIENIDPVAQTIVVDRNVYQMPDR
jgi:hypothetical protein